MTPYYQDEWRTLYHGDCTAIDLLSLGADAILTDPPRGLSMDGVIIPTHCELGHLFNTRLPCVVWATQDFCKPWQELVCMIGLPVRGRILDPYAGSGAILDAATEIGFKGVAIEIDEALCAAMAERWSR
jgi:DNA modification methylase